MKPGIHCSPEVLQYYTQLFKKRSHRYLIFRIPSSSRMRKQSPLIEVEKAAPRNANFSDFVHDLPKAEARYAVYDFSYITPDWGVKDAILFIHWTPYEGSHTRYRTTYALTKAAILGELRELSVVKDVEVTDAEDLLERKMLNSLLPIREKGVDLKLGAVQEMK